MPLGLSEVHRGHHSITFDNLINYAVDLDGNTFHPNVLDFGPALFNGWITKLVGLHLGVDEGDVVKRTSILENVWGYDHYSGSNVVDTKVSSLRKKMGDYAPMIETVSGLGYRFKRI